MNTDGIFALLATEDFGAYAMSLDQEIVFWNRGAEQILGYPADQVLGRHCYEVVTGVAPGGLTPACLKGCPSIRALQAGTVPKAVSLQMLCASGERKTASLTAMVISSAPDGPPLLVHLFEDTPEGAPSDLIAETVRGELAEGGADIVSDHPALPSAGADAAALTARELEVLALVALGRATGEIASELGISEHTVRNHVRHFRQKLHAGTKLEAVLTALRQGILEWS